MESSSQLSLHQENYLEVIYELCQDHGHAHTKAIADQLGIKMASVTEALRGLSARGLINYESRKEITMTDQGSEIAGALARRHQILADFLHNILGCSLERAERAACRIEHVIDDRIKNRLAEFAQFIRDEAQVKQGENLIEKFQRLYREKNASESHHVESDLS